MYEARQRKEKVSRRIEGGSGVKQREKVPPKSPESSKKGLDDWIAYMYDERNNWLNLSKKEIVKNLYNYYSRYEHSSVYSVDNKKFIEDLKIIESISKIHLKENVSPYNIRAYLGEQRYAIYPQGAKNKSMNSIDSSNESIHKKFAFRAFNKHKHGKNLSRLTLRLNPEKATEVFAVVSSMIVGSQDFPFVQQAKIMGPIEIQNKSDSLIIYVTSNKKDDIMKIIKLLLDNFNESYFLDGGPISMEPLGKGIYYAERAQYPDASSSHGKSRAILLAQAYEEMKVKSLYFYNKDAFCKHIYRKFKANDINPDIPHENLRKYVSVGDLFG